MESTIIRIKRKLTDDYRDNLYLSNNKKHKINDKNENNVYI